jgi:exodeoxyribonuclease V alpha subunit
MDLFDRSGRPPAVSPERDQEIVEGTVERVVFSGGGGAFTVVRLAVSGQHELVTVVGSLLGVAAGARLRVRGRFEADPRFGRQLRATGYTEIAPETVEGIRRYLGSGLIRGIGPEFASRIVARFGVRTLEILDAQPDRIGEVPGIGRVRAEAVKSAWTAQRQIRDVMVFLQGHGVSPAFAVRIFKRYGPAAIARVRENPYRLAFDVWGIGFLSADRLAGALGIRPDSEVRVAAGVRHVLDEAGGVGHVFLPRERLVADAAARLEVAPELVEAAVDRLAGTGEVVVEGAGSDAAVYELGLYRAERALAAGLLRLLAGGGAARVDPLSLPLAIASYERQAGITLAAQQAAAIRRATMEPVVVITGGPGVGKTTIVRGIVGILAAHGLRVALAAPTGRAAKRLSEATGKPAATLHRLLEWRPGEGIFGRNRQRPLEADLLVVDEASMLDVRLGADLVAACADGTRLVLVGDVDQLPSVGPGTVLRDVIASGSVPTVRLTEIFRQAASSLIVINAHRIHDGLLPEAGAGPADTRDFFFLEEEDPARAALLVRDLVATRLPRKYGLRPEDIQVLAPMHRGDLGAGHLNRLLQEALTGGAGGDELKSGGRAFRAGDRVMQLRNDYDKEVWNGDIGHVLRASAADAELWVRFDDREVRYGSEELDQMALAYAATVHKAQGSEYPAVVVPVHTQHYVMLQRNLLYTAVTRGKRLVVLVGSRKALAIAVRNGDLAARCSRLAARLKPGG